MFNTLILILLHEGAERQYVFYSIYSVNICLRLSFYSPIISCPVANALLNGFFLLCSISNSEFASLINLSK
jgi:hypothetical protein